MCPHPHTKEGQEVQNEKVGAYQALDKETQPPTLFQSTAPIQHNKAPAGRWVGAMTRKEQVRQPSPDTSQHFLTQMLSKKSGNKSRLQINKHNLPLLIQSFPY